MDLETDLVPGREFDGVELRVDGELRAELDDVLTQDFFRGARVTNPSISIATGQHALEVSLVSAGAEVLHRTARLMAEGTTGVTFAFHRSCLDVSCPVECIDGVCVDPEASGCVSGLEESCPEELRTRGCESDAACGSAVECVQARCASGLCLTAPEDAACEDQHVCDAAEGCVYVGPFRPWLTHFATANNDQWLWDAAPTRLGPCLSLNTGSSLTLGDRSEPASGAQNQHDLCFDSEGSLRWWTHLGDSGAGFETRTFDCTLDGRCASGGFVWGTSPTLPDGTALASTGNQDGFVAQYDAAGTLDAWTRFDGSGNQQVGSVRFAPDGSALAFGLVSYSATLTLEDGSVAPGASHDEWVTGVIDPEGASAQAFSPTDSGAASRASSALEANGRRLVGATLRDTVDIDRDGSAESTEGGRFVADLDASGALRNFVQITGAATATPLFTPSGIFVVGRYTGTSAPFGEDPSHGGADLYVLALDETLTPVASVSFGGPGEDIESRAHVSADGNIVITGTTGQAWERGPAARGAFLVEITPELELARWLSVPGGFTGAYGGLADDVAYLIGEATGTVSFAGEDTVLSDTAAEIVVLATDQLSE